MSFGIGDLNWNVYKKLILVRTGQEPLMLSKKTVTQILSILTYSDSVDA